MQIYQNGQEMTLPTFVRDVRTYGERVNVYVNPAMQYTFGQILAVAREYVTKFETGQTVTADDCVSTHGRVGLVTYEFVL